MAHVTFVHGIGSKPAQEDLLNDWRVALFDDDGLHPEAMAVTSSIVYWADMLYASPVPAGTGNESSELKVQSTVDYEDADLRWLDDIPEEERLLVERLGREFGLAEVTATPDEAALDPIGPGSPLEAIPPPNDLKRRLMRVLLRDVYHFLYNASFSPRPEDTCQIRTDVRAISLEKLQKGASQPGPHLLVGHSLGSVIGYDALTAIEGAPTVDALLTVGSPLGISEVPEGLTPQWTSHDGWPSHRIGEGRCSNVYDALDPVCGLFDQMIGTHYRQGGIVRVEGIGASNTGNWHNNAGKYLGQPRMRTFMHEVLR